MLKSIAPFILILVFENSEDDAGGVAMQEFTNYKSCNHALEKIKIDSRLTGYCVPKGFKD
jgi:hypothetical protein